MPAEIPDDIDYKELAESESPSTAGFTPEQGKAIMPYLFQKPDDEEITDEDLVDKVKEIMGSTSFDTGDGRLQRTLPPAHPIFWWLYASAINPVQGIGKPTFEEASPAADSTKTLPYYARYPAYRTKLEFTSRAYDLLEDDDIQLVDDEWIDFDGHSVSYKSATEWWRFTDFTIEPKPDFVTAQQGQYVFESTGGEPDGLPYTGMPKVYLPNQLIRFWWYQVPYRYYSSPNSYMQRWIGCINQDDWYDWKAGELLLLSISPHRHMPSVPEVDSWFGTPSTAKLANFEFQMLATRRKGEGVPTPSNGNFIAAGHNLLPWLGDRKFHYGRSNDSLKTPSFLSCPFPALFTDPDAEGGIPP